MASLDRYWPPFLDTVRAPAATATTFGLLAEIVGEAIGSKLTTATVFDVPAGRLRRIYSQNENAYAVGGYKPIPANKWTEQLIGRQQLYTALSIEAIAEDFFDWELIRSLGCESIANLPIVVGGQTIGAVNLLEAAGYYTPERLRRVPEVMPFATLAYLAAYRAEAIAAS
jgi:hypothetical protein